MATDLPTEATGKTVWYGHHSETGRNTKSEMAPTIRSQKPGKKV